MWYSIRCRGAGVTEFFEELIREWGQIWGLPGLADHLRVEFSSRLHRAIARAIPQKGIVRLTSTLRDGPRAAVAEVLCHEVAHVAAFRIHRRRIRPHGKEWADLVRRAGFTPNARFDPKDWPELRLPKAPRRRRRPAAVVFLHRCPVCQAARVARRPVRRWRCAACVDAGLSGELVITREPVVAIRRAG
jgi:predicted SprT family Zn-dependent metalloprotease